MQENIKYLALLHNIWISQNKLNSIFENNSCYEDFYNNISFETLKKAGIRENQIAFILEQRQKFDLKYIEKQLKKRNSRIITKFDLDFPENLKNIPNSPYLLYVRWVLDNSPSFAVVGSRKITSYWKSVIEKIVPELSAYFVIISWGAYGCDTEAHKSTLKAWNKTIAFVWTWINIDYPVWNEKFYDEIVEKWWAVVSVFPFEEVWNPYNFPIRNELVAWISSWVLLVEAQEKSWSLITAQLALDLWKDLFAIPWDIFRSNSSWTNKLISTWQAKLVTNVFDILSEYNFKKEEKKEESLVTKIKFDNELDKKIYDILILEALSSNDICKKLNLDISAVSFRLSMMEISWIIKSSLWWKYQIK